MVALGLDANAAQPLFFFSGEGNFEGGITRLNVAATLAFGAVVKQHASTSSDTWCDQKSAHRKNNYKCHRAWGWFEIDIIEEVQTKKSLCSELITTT